MIQLFQRYKLFILPFLFLVLISILLKAFFTKEELFLFVNSHHTSALDKLFFYFTHVGDGLMFVGLVLILCFIQFRKAVLGLIIYIVSSELAQILKRLIFPDAQRPKKYFEGIQELHFVDGVTVHNMMSFPSGHTTSAFALACFVLFIIPQEQLKKYSWLLLLMACLVAYSRMYLAQHFFEDVFMGAVLGTFTAFITKYFIDNAKWIKHPFFDKSLLRLKS